MQGSLGLVGVRPRYGVYGGFDGWGPGWVAPVPGLGWGYGGGGWGPAVVVGGVGRRHLRRRYRLMREQLESGEEIEKRVEVLDANEPYDFSEDEAAGDDEDEASVEDADAEFDEAGDAEEAAEKPANAPLLQAAAPAAPAAAAASNAQESIGLSIAENARLMALRAKIIAHPLAAKKVLSFEEIACDSCGKHKPKAPAPCDDDESSSSSDSECDSESESSSDDEQCAEPPKKLCPPCKKKQEQKKKKVKCEAVTVVVCHAEPPPPCNKEQNTEPIVKGKCPPEQCKLRDTEVTKTFEQWAASKSKFAPAGGDADVQLCSVAAASDKPAITRDQIVVAERLVKEFAAQGGLKIDEKAEKASLAKLASAIGNCKKFEGEFEHVYVSAPLHAALLGAIDPVQHVQPLTIKALSSCTKNSAGQMFYYLSVAVKPRDVGSEWSETANKVFRISLNPAAKKFDVQVTADGKAALEKQIGAKASNEVLGKMYSLLTSALPINAPSSPAEAASAMVAASALGKK